MKHLPLIALRNQAPLLAVGIGLVVVVWMLIAVALGLSDAARQRLSTRAAVSRSLAEELAVAVAVRGSAEFSRHGFHAVGRRVDSEGRSDLELLVSDRSGARRSYRGDVLPGAAPQPLSRALSILRPEVVVDPLNDPDWNWLSNPAVPEPQWLTAGLPRLRSPERRVEPEEFGVVRDSAIALLRLPAGTDQEDYVLAGGAGEARRPTIPDAGIVYVPGNLWFVDATGVLTIELSDALTVVVDGNLYVDADIRVLGRGDLVLVVRDLEGSTFVDVDRDGRFSRADRGPEGERYGGFMEGSGCVHFGVPGEPRVDALSFEPSLAVHGDVFLRRRRLDLHGTVLLGAKLVRDRSDREVRVTGRRLPDVHRRRIPGFETRGVPRPGVLEPVPAGAFSDLASSIPVGPR